MIHKIVKAGNPVLVCMDQCNYLTQGCYVVVYDDPEKIRSHPEQRGLPHWTIRAKFDEVVTDSRRLNLMRHFKRFRKKSSAFINLFSVFWTKIGLVDLLLEQRLHIKL